MPQEDWRIRIETEGEHTGGLLERLRTELGAEARELARDLEAKRLAVSRDGSDVYVYADSRDAAVRAGEIVDAEVREHGVAARASRVEHWLEDEERWDDEPAGESWEADELERGFAPWEVRVECGSHREALDLADRLEEEGYGVTRRWRFLVVGTASKQDAEALAERVHGRVEPGGELVWETVPGNPFAVFGGLGSS